LRCDDDAILGSVVVDILNEVEELQFVVVSALACAVEEEYHRIAFVIVIIIGEKEAVGENGIVVFVGVEGSDLVNVALCACGERHSK
jgi:hypothetical protein